MPIPSASSKFFWLCSKCFDRLQYFLNVFKYFWPRSNLQIYKVQFYFWPWSKIFDCFQKILDMVKMFWTQLRYFWTSRWNRHSCKFKNWSFEKLHIFVSVPLVRGKFEETREFIFEENITPIYLSVLDFWHSLAWNIKFDELDLTNCCSMRKLKFEISYTFRVSNLIMSKIKYR